MSDRKAKNDRLVVRLESEVRASLRERAAKLGLDEATYVRVLIYRDASSRRDDMGDYIADAPPTRPGRPHHWLPPDAGPGDDRGAARDVVGHEPAALDEPDELPVEEMEIPPDPDGDPEPMGPGPSLLDEIAALTAMPRPEPVQQRQAPAYARHRPSGTQFRSRFNNRDWGRVPSWGPGSMTRAVGVGGELTGNMQGDGVGNVIRDNFAHFGAVGTRSR